MPKVKPGKKTTEFWLTVAAQVVGVVLEAVAVAWPEAWYGLVAGAGLQGLSALGYSVSRGVAKHRSPDDG